MNTTGFTDEILAELKQTLAGIDDEQAEKLVTGILQAKKVFVAGGGRSGFMRKLSSCA